MAVIPMETRQIGNIWWVFLLQGLAAIVLGLMLLTNPGATLVALVTVLGIYWLITGVLSLVRVFVDHTVPWIWSLIIGIVGILAGIIVLNHPLLSALTAPVVIVAVLGVQGLVMGVIEIVHAFTSGGLGPFALGAVNILLGLVLLASPYQAAAAVPTVFGILLMIQGACVSLWAIRLHREPAVAQA